jgi:predicted enzyme related to lactoylglutathione lyase
MIEGFAFSMYPVTDMKRARAFYEKELKLKPTREFGENFIEYHLDGNCFTLTKMEGGNTPSSTMGGTVTFEVSDLKALLKTLRDKKMKIKMDVMDFPNCSMAVVLDPEGNSVGLHQRKK